MFSAIHGGTDQFECSQYNGHAKNLFNSDGFFCHVVTPYYQYIVESNILLSKLKEIEYKQQVKYHVFETFLSMVPTQNEIKKFIVDVTYKYDVYAQVLHDILAHNDDNKVICNN